MPSSFEAVAEQALSLNAHDSIRVATGLLKSVEPEASKEAEQTWEDEIVRRIAQIDSGSARGRDWEEIKREFESRYGSGPSAKSRMTRACCPKGNRSADGSSARTPWHQKLIKPAKRSKGKMTLLLRYSCRPM